MLKCCFQIYCRISTFVKIKTSYVNTTTTEKTRDKSRFDGGKKSKWKNFSRKNIEKFFGLIFLKGETPKFVKTSKTNFYTILTPNFDAGQQKVRKNTKITYVPKDHQLQTSLWF